MQHELIYGFFRIEAQNMARWTMKVFLKQIIMHEDLVSPTNHKVLHFGRRVGCGGGGVLALRPLASQTLEVNLSH